jgi:hypothetical protein
MNRCERASAREPRCKSDRHLAPVGRGLSSAICPVGDPMNYDHPCVRHFMEFLGLSARVGS